MIRGIILTAVIMCAGAWADDGWWNASWHYRQQVSINTKDITENLENFPLRLHMTDGQFARALAAPQGRDMRIINADGQELAHEIVAWEPDGVEIYIRMPQLKTGSGQHLYVYFGNPDAPETPPVRVWDDAYHLILHLQGDMADALGTVEPVKREGCMFQNGWTPGLISAESHPWATFCTLGPGSLNVNPEILQKLGPTATFTLRFRPKGTEKRVLFAASAADAKNGMEAVVAPDSASVDLIQDVVRSSLPYGNGVEPERWHSIVVAVDNVQKQYKFTVDGAAMAQGAYPGLAGPFDTIKFGRALLNPAELYFLGDVDEVRMAAVSRTNAWMAAEALSLSEANPLVNIGPLESQDGTPPPPVAPELLLPVTGSQSHKTAGIELSWRPSVGSETYAVALYEDAAASRLINKLEAGNATKLIIQPSVAPQSTIYWTVIAQSAHGETPAHEMRRLDFYTWAEPGVTNTPKEKASQKLQTAQGVRIELDGYLRERVGNMVRYLTDYNERNPGLLRMLRERPEKDIPGWAGVFPGQYLSSAELLWRVTRDEKLKAAIDAYVDGLIASQREDGYLGPFEDLRGWCELWNHYSAMIGLLQYYDDTQDAAALAACEKLGHLLAATYGPDGASLNISGGSNETICHAMAQLYKRTGKQVYLDFVNYVMKQAWSEPGGPDLLNCGLEHRPVAKFPMRRWETIHNLGALSEMYWLEGNEDYAKAYQNIWWELAKGDRHITGGFSTNEGLLGTPYNPGTIETCCTVAWIIISTDMLKLTGDARVADELEWSTLNSALGSIPFDGSTSTYSNQPDGARHYGKEIFQGPKDGAELNCCSTNAYRALGMLSEWGLMQDKDGLFLNYYGPSAWSAQLPSGNKVSLKQDTRYPADGLVRITVTPEKAERFTLHLRIPRWSKTSQCSVNGKAIKGLAPGNYLAVTRKWRAGDTVELRLDFSPWFWAGEQECSGKLAVYRGPILYTFDARFNNITQENMPALDCQSLAFEPMQENTAPQPWILTRIKDHAGSQFTACDFSSAGMTGTPYRSWFPSSTLPPSPFHLVSPRNGEAGASFQWERAAGAESWVVLLGKERGLAVDSQRIETSQPECAVPSLKPGTYYWTVEAINKYGRVEAANGPFELTVAAR